MKAPFALLAVPALIPLSLVTFNVLFWTRGRALPDAGRAAPGGVSVLIPARNEVANIERCVRAVDRGCRTGLERESLSAPRWDCQLPRGGAPCQCPSPRSLGSGEPPLSRIVDL